MEAGRLTGRPASAGSPQTRRKREASGQGEKPTPTSATNTVLLPKFQQNEPRFGHVIVRLRPRY